jgi:uncharacterized protein (PEP-CTERM system associated)
MTCEADEWSIGAATRPSRWRRACGATRSCVLFGAVCLALPHPAVAAVTVAPSLSISGSMTDNRLRSTTGKESEATARVTAGLRVGSSSGPVTGSLDYSLSSELHSDGSSRNGISQGLSAGFSVVAIERHATVDVSARISQQSISAFGVQSDGTRFDDPNRTEVRSLTISPRLQGRIGDIAAVSASATLSKTSSLQAGAGDSQSINYALGANGRVGVVGWNLNYGLSISDFAQGRETENSRVGWGLSVRPHYDWGLTLRGGREWQSVLAVRTTGSATWGLGADWTPSPRTSLSAQYDRRYFGNSHSFSISHRMARSVWSYSNSRNSSEGLSTAGGTEYVSQYQRLMAQLAPVFPNLIERDAQVRLLLAQQGGLLTRAVSLQHSQSASMALQGLRASVTLSLTRSDSSRLDKLSPADDDLSISGRVRQTGFSLNGSYRLLPGSSATLGFSTSRTSGTGTAPGNELRTLTAGYSTQLLRSVSFNLTARHVVFDSATRPYTENGLQASLGFSF